MADEPDELDLEDGPDLAQAQLDEPENPDEVEDEGEPAPLAADGSARPVVETSPAEPRQASRSERRIQSQQEENRRLTSELADARRRMDEMERRFIQQNRPPAETPEQRAQRHAMMAPQDVMAEQLRESEVRMTQFMQYTAVTNADNMDRTAFQAKAAVDPLYQRWASKVEGRLAEERAKGNNLEREVLLKFLIGEAALERRTSKEGRAEVRQAQRRVAAQRGRPVNSGSDTQAQRRQTSTLEQRLENVQI